MKINFIEIIKLLMCLGFGFVTTGVFWLISFYNMPAVRITNLDRSSIFGSTSFVLFGLIFIFYSLIVYISRYKKGDKKIRIQILVITIFFLYGITTMILGLNYSRQTVENEVIITKKFMMFVMGGASLFLGGLYYLLITIGEYYKKLIVTSIKDPKDRVTVVIAIFGSIISLIALFK